MQFGIMFVHTAHRYAHYDRDPSFNDFKPFGGWSKPSMKQFTGGATVCGE